MTATRERRERSSRRMTATESPTKGSRFVQIFLKENICLQIAMPYEITADSCISPESTESSTDFVLKTSARRQKVVESFVPRIYCREVECGEDVHVVVAP